MVEEGAAVFTCGDDFYTDKDIIEAAFFRGEVSEIWKDLLRCVECENQSGDAEMDDAAIDSAVETFRYNHDLITAEETEQWLEARGLTMDDFGEYFARHYWGKALPEVVPPAMDYISAPDDMRKLLRAEIILSGEFDRMAMRMAWRAAAKKENKEDVDPAEEKAAFFNRAGTNDQALPNWLSGLGRDDSWFNDMLRMEAIHRRIRGEILTLPARQREMSSMRLPLTRLEVEVIELESKDAASEASLCVTADGLSMEEVAKEGRYPYRRTHLLVEDIDPDLQQKFLSVTTGSVLDPIARGDGFQLWRIVEKVEPNAEDPVVQERIDKRLLDLHFSKLVANNIHWQGVTSHAQ